MASHLLILLANFAKAIDGAGAAADVLARVVRLGNQLMASKCNPRYLYGITFFAWCYECSIEWGFHVIELFFDFIFVIYNLKRPQGPQPSERTCYQLLKPQSTNKKSG